jgi:tetratricopeptide (TPR) repeat protein
MANRYLNFKYALTATLLMVCLCAPNFSVADTKFNTLAQLYQKLSTSTQSESVSLEKEIRFLWQQSGSDVVDLILKRAQNAQNRLEHGLAAEHFTAVIELAPDFSPGWTGRASAYLALELHGPALADLQDALRLDPQNFEALTGLGVILEQLDAPELALRAYDEVLAIHPHLEQVINARSRVAKIVAGQPL